MGEGGEWRGSNWVGEKGGGGGWGGGEDGARMPPCKGVNQCRLTAGIHMCCCCLDLAKFHGSGFTHNT